MEAKNRVVAIILTFFLGALGIHKFYLGYNFAGLI
jgi:TM2 domain-containing membrane protein YozV